LLEAWLRDRGQDVLATREPGGTRLGERIRELLLAGAQQPLAADAELLLMFAARAQHLSAVILPALSAGKWVICDRFTDASYAYQGAARELGFERVQVLENWLQGDFRPDLVVLLDLSVAEGLRRARSRGAGDRFESESEAFFERVRKAYLDRAGMKPDRYRRVDASDTVSVVQVRIRDTLQEFWGAELG
jgi:dTMP kinase